MKFLLLISLFGSITLMNCVLCLQIAVVILNIMHIDVHAKHRAANLFSCPGVLERQSFWYSRRVCRSQYLLCEKKWGWCCNL